MACLIIFLTIKTSICAKHTPKFFSTIVHLRQTHAENFGAKVICAEHVDETFFQLGLQLDKGNKKHSLMDVNMELIGKYLPEVRHLFPDIFGINVTDSDDICCADAKYDVHIWCK